MRKQWRIKMEITQISLKVQAAEGEDSYDRLTSFLSAVAVQRRELSRNHWEYLLPKDVNVQLKPDRIIWHDESWTDPKDCVKEYKLFDYVRTDATVSIKRFGQEPAYLRKLLEKSGTIVNERVKVTSLDEVLGT